MSDAAKIQEAHAYVDAWLNDDAEFPIPLNDFGFDLAHFLDVLLDATKGDKRD